MIDPKAQTVELEMQIIGCCLLAGQGKDLLSDLMRRGLTPEWFTDPYAGATFDALSRMFGRGDPVIELTTVWHELGGIGSQPPSEWLETCVDMVPTGKFSTYYLETLRPLFQRRMLHADLEAAAEDAQVSGIEDAHKLLQGAMSNANERLAAASPEESFRSRVKAIVEQFTLPAERTEWISWPIPELDRNVGRIDKELVYIAARPSVGKTAFVVQMLLRAARSGIQTSMKSLESPVDQVIIRMLANIGVVNMLEIKQDKARGEDLQHMLDAAVALEGFANLIRISDRPVNAAELSAWAQVEAARGSKMLVIDNLKHIRPDPKIKNVVEQFRSFSAAIKAIRDDVCLPVVVVHHLSRGGELSWSDDMERDADIVIHLGMDDRLNAGTDTTAQCVVKCEVRKNRDGVAGVIMPLLFRKDIQTFDAYRDSEPAYV